MAADERSVTGTVRGVAGRDAKARRVAGTAPGLFATVVSGGFCIGCGACAAMGPAVSILFDEMGRYVAVPALPGGVSDAAIERVCPFSSSAADEDAIGLALFGETATADPRLGRYRELRAGWVVEGTFRSDGSTGGLATWFLVDAFRSGIVDAVVHVVPRSGRPLFAYGISTTEPAIRRGAKSRYYPVEMSEAIRTMLEVPGRYAFVGVPCFVKALRLACRESRILRERVVLVVGLFCGHSKSAAFAESMAWQSGIRPDAIEAIDFRRKIPGAPASRYGVSIAGRSGEARVVVERESREYFGNDWGEGFFKIKACDFCDDVVAETADVSIGDAWLPRYDEEGGGTNLVVVRSSLAAEMLERGAAEGRLHLEPTSVDEVVASQAGGFRHRREGLAYRLHLEDLQGHWRPPKRVLPSAKGIPNRRKRVYEMRALLAAESHEAFLRARAAGSVDGFVRAMRPLSDRYRKLLQPPIHRRMSGAIRRILSRVKRAIR